jgi:hypothetical protein
MATNTRTIRAVALPTEHGGWGFLAEPILLGLLVAPSWAGLLLSLAAVAVFLLHQPLKYAIKDHLKGRRVSRTVWAERFSLIYAAVAAVSFGAVLLTQPELFLVPLLIGGAIGTIQLSYDARNKSRNLIPEVAGALALGAAAPAIALVGGWTLLPALLLWLVLAFRAMSSILYVRARLRLEYGRPYQAAPVYALHGLALLVLGGLVVSGVLHWLILLPFIFLTGRAAYGLSAYRRQVKAKVVGFSELGYGLVTVLIVAVGMGWVG